RIARIYVEGRRVTGVDSGRVLPFCRLVDDQHDREVVIHSPLRIDDLENLAVFPWFGVATLHVLPRRLRAVGERPFLAVDPARGAQRARAVQRYFLSGPDQMVRPCPRDELRLILPLIGFPEKGVAFLDAPLAGRLLAFDVEV